MGVKFQNTISPTIFDRFLQKFVIYIVVIWKYRLLFLGNLPKIQNLYGTLKFFLTGVTGPYGAGKCVGLS